MSDENEGQSDMPDGVQIQTISLAEPEGQRTTALEWSRRAKIAVAELQGLLERFEAHNWPVDNAQRIYDDSIRVLVQTLLLEARIRDDELSLTIPELLDTLRRTGRVTNDEMVARCSEVQLLYLKPQFQQRCTTPQTSPQTPPQPKPVSIVIAKR